MFPFTPVPVPASAAWLGLWARPPDRPAQVALGLALALLAVAVLPGGPDWLAALVDFSAAGDLRRRRRFLAVASFVAAFLSLGYIAFYLRGGPRDALAPVYWLEGRGLAHGQLSWLASEPVASFRAAHLLTTASDRVAGILPPGYPLLLAFGFRVGAPMLVGPLLSAALCVVTWGLARELALAAGEREERAEGIARAAVGLSIVSASLRLASADTVPQGAAAVAVATALTLALLARRLGDPRLFGLSGLALGGVAATHPPSVVAVGAIVLALGFGARPPLRAVAWTLVMAAPGVLLLLAAHRAATGHAFASPSAAYFASVATPANVDVHGVAAVVKRLRAHLADVDNLEPLVLLALVPMWKGRSRAAILAVLVVVGHVAVTASSGPDVSTLAAARGLASVIPVEHALIALALSSLFPARLASAALGTMALALAGFAVHASHDHHRLALAGLGRPHYEPDTARENNVTSGLLYFDDDDGFELAFDPFVPASHGVEAVRLRGDDHDRLLYDMLGHPQIHRYAVTEAGATANGWTPPNAGSDTWRFEAESDWPPLARGAKVEIVDGLASCVSDGKVLTVTAPGDDEVTVWLELPTPRGPVAPERKGWAVTPRVLQRGSPGKARMLLVDAPGGLPFARWTWDDGARGPACVDLPTQHAELGGDRTRAWLELHVSAGSVSLDKTTLHPR